MTISDPDRQSFTASSAIPVLPWLAQLAAVPGRLFARGVGQRRRWAESDFQVFITDVEINDLSLERGLYEGRRSTYPAVLRAQRWLSTFPHWRCRTCPAIEPICAPFPDVQPSLDHGPPRSLRPACPLSSAEGPRLEPPGWLGGGVLRAAHGRSGRAARRAAARHAGT